ncbi:hypothetical protein WR25_16805 [Diploscapter pachys]|uniref:Uncharacterized protein n=1 Tax=Diploscapter pachys TaxID=2018661 RepID=A0A2A2M3L4_9BILA|nr:hypothetical protein WR25_16805 [Diploscapter pachys]
MSNGAMTRRSAPRRSDVRPNLSRHRERSAAIQGVLRVPDSGEALLLGRRRARVLAVAFGGGDDVARRRALVDDVGLRVTDLGTDAGIRRIAAGLVDDAILRGAACRVAAEQRVERLRGRLIVLRAGGARLRRDQCEIGRDHQRRLTRDGEFVGTRTARPARIGTDLRMGILRGNVALVAHQERADKQHQHAEGDRGIRDVEDEERLPSAEVQIGEIDDVAKPHTVGDIAERPAQDRA